MSRWKLLFFYLTLFCAGCSGSDTLLILMRDTNALQAEIADSLIMVVDESSAQGFLEQHIPRLLIRAEKLGGRIEMWEKYADDEKKKIKSEVDKIRDVAMKAKGGVEAAAFDKLSEGAEFFRLVSESQNQARRISDETKRIQLVVYKLAEKKSFAILEEWRAAGRKDSPRIRRYGEPSLGQEVDPEKEWPFLYKMQDPMKAVGGKAFSK